MTSRVTRRAFLGAATAAAAGTGASAAATSAPEGAGALKIVGVACSHRKGKTTMAALQIALAAAKAADPGIAVEAIELAGLDIRGYIPPEQGGNPKDDFDKLVPVLGAKEVGGIIVATPVYYGSMSSLCKAFLERCAAFRTGYLWANKAAGVIAVAGNRNGGQELTIQTVQAALFCHEMLLVGDGRPTLHRGATLWNSGNDDITKDEIGVQTAKSLGRRIAEVARRVAQNT
jgi:multimeric flavodoxin WrbA